MDHANSKDNYSYAHIRYIRRPLTALKRTRCVTTPPKLHFHNAHELLLITQGRYSLYAPKKVYEGEGACIVLYKIGTYHASVRIDCENTPFDCYVVNYHQSVIEAFPSYMFDCVELYEKNVCIIPIDNETVDFIANIFDKLIELSDSYSINESVPPKMYGYFLSIINFISELVKDGKSIDLNVEGDNEYYISKVIEVITKKIEKGEDISVLEVAELFFVSRSKLSKNFYKATGVTVKHMIDHLRLERIKTMLRRGLDNKEIAKQCGFLTDSYFIQFFNKHMGMSPGKYRQQHMN